MSLMESQPPDIDEDDDDVPEAAQDFDYALGPGINAALTRRGPELIVCFGDKTPLGPVIEEMDWSVLHLEADDPADLMGDRVVGFFDALLDSTLLDEFDAVLFFGSGASTNAALGFSICAPLARILILGPSGPLSQDTRFAPNATNLSVAETIHVVFDPRDPDMSDAARAIAARGATPLPMRFGDGGPMPEALADIGALDDVMEDAVTGQLSDTSFFRALRARRHNNRYQRRLTGRLIRSDHPVLQVLLLRHVGVKQGRARYLRQYKELERELSEKGVTVPPARD